MSSSITKVLNHLSDSVVFSAITGGIGYLCARVVKHDPLVGLACGATTGVIAGLFGAKGANLSSKIVGLAAIIFVPFQVCQRLELPTTFKTAAVLTGVSLATPSLIYFLYLQSTKSEKMKPSSTIVR